MSRSARLLALVLACLGLTGCVSLPRVDVSRSAAMAQTTVLYDAAGHRLTSLHGTEDRTTVSLAAVSHWIPVALVDTEDARFFEHDGVDLRGIARAALADVKHRGLAEGGSTITQQYVRNVYITKERTVSRKVREATAALEVERRYSKNQILEAYLNTVYFGDGAYGIEAAAHAYFSTTAARVTLPQAAMLAGLVRSPSADDPLQHPKQALRRRAEVLRDMARLGHLSEPALAAALRAPLGIRPGRVPRYPAAWFVRWVTDQLLDPANHDFDALGTSLGQRTTSLFTGGLRITTTVDMRLQAEAERAARAVLTDPRRDPWPAVVSVEPRTGAVRAMVGGRDFFDDRRFGRLNLALGGSTGRQAGSSFKVFALVAALEQGVPPQALFPAPSSYAMPWNGGSYLVHNYEQEAFGNATLRDATAFSINTVYAQLLLRIGHGSAAAGTVALNRMAAKLGITTKLGANPSNVLGTTPVSPLEMAGAYATLAGGGRQADPYGVSRITDATGRVLYQAAPASLQVMSPGTVAITDAVLGDVIDHGTGTRADIGRPAAGKTGTTERNSDAWFVGYTPSLATAVWVGFPEGSVPMRPPRTAVTVFGGTYPAAIWQRYMAAAMAGGPPVGFPRAVTTVVQVVVDVRQDCLRNRFTPSSVVGKVTYLKGREPTTICASPAVPVPGVVPALVGLPLRSAEALLSAAGFGLTQHLERSDTAAAGTVLGQSPLGGTAFTGRSVTLTVAVDAKGTGGDGVTLVPDLVGLDTAGALSALGAFGLQGSLFAGCRTTAGVTRAGEVWATRPGAGGQVASHSVVEVHVGPAESARCVPPTTTTPPTTAPPTTTTNPPPTTGQAATTTAPGTTGPAPPSAKPTTSTVTPSPDA